jgi:hypothetical protein
MIGRYEGYPYSLAIYVPLTFIAMYIPSIAGFTNDYHTYTFPTHVSGEGIYSKRVVFQLNYMLYINGWTPDVEVSAYIEVIMRRAGNHQFIEFRDIDFLSDYRYRGIIGWRWHMPTDEVYVRLNMYKEARLSTFSQLGAGKTVILHSNLEGTDWNVLQPDNGFLGIGTCITLCQPGFYSSQSPGAECMPCPAGTFANISGATACTACPGGTYSSNKSSEACTPCGKGSYSTENGATSNSTCQLCQAGTYSSDAAKQACTPCPVGMYSATRGAYRCVACGNLSTSYDMNG